MFKIIQFISLVNRVATILGKSCQLCLPSILWLLNCIFLSLPLVLDVDLTVSVPEFTFTLLTVTGISLFCICRMPILAYVHMFKMPKTVSSKVTKYHTFSTTSQIIKKKSQVFRLQVIIKRQSIKIIIYYLVIL